LTLARLALEIDGTRLEVDPRAGGRVVSLRLGDREVLSGPDVHPDNYGSTFWTSPQSDWGWPPPAEIDRAAYSVDATGDVLAVSGSPHGALGARVSKRFSTDLARRAFAIEYAIHNVSDSPKKYAPWEVTRVPPGGLAFFPTGMPSSGALHLDERSGASWFAHDSAMASGAGLPATGLKAFASGKRGWLAHARQGLLYIKRFDEVPRELQAPGEAEIEIYANRAYVELEVQGCYTTILPGGSASWTVTWCVRDIPDGIAVGTGSVDLLEFADGLVRSLE
jgi:hypothetical protein